MQSAFDMTGYWRQLDDEVAQTPMPAEYQNMMVEVREAVPVSPLPAAPCLVLLAAEGTRNPCWSGRDVTVISVLSKTIHPLHASSPEPILQLP